MLEAADAEIEWIDVADDNGAVREIDADLDFVRERLHVVGSDGKVRVGSDAFETLWKITPGQKLLGKISAFPVVKTLFRWSYNGFAALLYRWNKLNRRW